MKMYKGHTIELRKELSIWRLIATITGTILVTVLVYIVMVMALIIGG